MFEGRSLPRTPATEGRPPQGSPSRGDASRGIPIPRAPDSSSDTGLSLGQLADLVLKHLSVDGCLTGAEIARRMHLPFASVEEPLRFLKDEHSLEVLAGEVFGPVSYRFQLTDLGRTRAREAVARCGYIGPAPVTLEAYAEQAALQHVSGTTCNAAMLVETFDELVLSNELIETLGPAICTGRSIFIFGPPGNGKSAVSKGIGRLLNNHGGEIYVPYAVQVEAAVITIFDPMVHTPVENGPAVPMYDTRRRLLDQVNADPSVDQRWRRVRRPVVMTGGELTLEMLDLRPNLATGVYQAPPHLKANGGVFLIDDFGRQVIRPRDLLNRWILPLEERIDFLTLASGKKFAVPFEELIVFSTNLEPHELVDDAFLRRIRHKIPMMSPTRELYTAILRSACERKGLTFPQECLDSLFSIYDAAQQQLRGSDPRDLLEIAASICRFRNQEFRLSPELLVEAARKFFCHIESAPGNFLSRHNNETR
ncbi:MAG TPA: ATPase [Planctomycetaceae bacterium]|nr:ATPase [Planctomycetaceae bacterium]